MLTVTIGRDSHNQPVLQREFRDFAGLYGFVVRCARAHRAKTKGKVERAIGFIQTSFLPGRNIALGGQSKSHTDVQLKTAHESVGTSKPHA